MESISLVDAIRFFKTFPEYHNYAFTKANLFSGSLVTRENRNNSTPYKDNSQTIVKFIKKDIIDKSKEEMDYSLKVFFFLLILSYFKAHIDKWNLDNKNKPRRLIKTAKKSFYSSLIALVLFLVDLILLAVYGAFSPLLALLAIFFLVVTVILFVRGVYKKMKAKTVLEFEIKRPAGFNKEMIMTFDGLIERIMEMMSINGCSVDPSEDLPQITDFPNTGTSSKTIFKLKETKTLSDLADKCGYGFFYSCGCRLESSVMGARSKKK